MITPRGWWLLAFVALTAVLGAFAQAGNADAKEKPPVVTADYVREHYTKYEYLVPMRDGVRLHTTVYAPKDESEKRPILLTRTPYGVQPYGVDRYMEPRHTLLNYGTERFIFVYQDVRGRKGSEGEFVHLRPHRPRKGPTDIDESTDAYDTIDWLVRNLPNNNGNVGMMGTSYPGFYSSAGMIDSHPALKCVSPQAPIADWFIGDDFHHNGAFYLPHAFGFLAHFGQTLDKPTREDAKRFDYETPDGYDFYLRLGSLANIEEKFFKGRISFWKELMQHGTYDEFWQSRDIRPHLRNVKAAVMTVGGWYDAEDLFGTLHTYAATERQNPGIRNTLVLGPWVHGGWNGKEGDKLGQVKFHAKTAQYYRDNIERPFLKHHLLGAPDPKLPEAFVFETGTNIWRRHEEWPPKRGTEKSLFLQAGGKLGFAATAAAAARNPPDSFDEYVSDPAKPVPFIVNTAIGMTREHMVDDQRFASSRTDVLVYQTEPLEEDLTLAGPITAELYVSTTGTDSDFVVKLIDVYTGDHPDPDPNPANVKMGGYQQLVRGEPFRGKFRKSFTNPEPFTPGKVEKIEFVLPDVYHTFRRGHRVMVHVQSSWFPLVDRNPQTFCDIYAAKPEDFKKATQRVYRGPEGQSRIRVKVLGR